MPTSPATAGSGADFTGFSNLDNFFGEKKQDAGVHQGSSDEHNRTSHPNGGGGGRRRGGVGDDSTKDKQSTTQRLLHEQFFKVGKRQRDDEDDNEDESSHDEDDEEGVLASGSRTTVIQDKKKNRTEEPAIVVAARSLPDKNTMKKPKKLGKKERQKQEQQLLEQEQQEQQQEEQHTQETEKGVQEEGITHDDATGEGGGAPSKIIPRTKTKSKRKKVRSRQKNIRKDHRAEHEKPGYLKQHNGKGRPLTQATREKLGLPVKLTTSQTPRRGRNTTNEEDPTALAYVLDRAGQTPTEDHATTTHHTHETPVEETLQLGLDAFLTTDDAQEELGVKIGTTDSEHRDDHEQTKRTRSHTNTNSKPKKKKNKKSRYKNL